LPKPQRWASHLHPPKALARVQDKVVPFAVSTLQRWRFRTGSPASWVEYSYQLFLILKLVVQSVEPLKLSKVELKLQIKLMDAETDPLLKGWVAPNWWYMKQALADHRGKRFKRSELPYKIMGAYLARTESPKSPAEVELAKREQLV